MNDGYIKVFRKILSWEWYDDVNTFKLWMHLLLIANHKDNKWRGEVIKRGSTVTSYAQLSVQTGLTVQQVRTSLKKLQKTAEVTKVTSSKNTVIIVTNYDKYQDSNKQDNKQINNVVTNNQQSSNKQVTTNNNDKKDKNDNNDKNIKDIYLSEQLEIAPTESFITLDLKTGDEFPVYEQEIKEWQMTYPNVDIVCELRKMKSWLEANPKRRKTRTGMKRFINGWLSREQDKKDEQKGDFAF